MTIEIIGAGYSRTGTMSMIEAFKTLGVSPVYHGIDIMAPEQGSGTEKHLEAWADHLGNRKTLDWQQHFQGFKVSLDFPACVYYKELAETFPDAKVILTLRDADSWYNSMEVIRNHCVDAKDLPDSLPRKAALVDFLDNLSRMFFLDDREACLENYHRHIEQVKKTIPASRLLVFNVSQGWEPLCSFLEKPIPDMPFPHAHDGEFIREHEKEILGYVAAGQTSEMRGLYKEED